MWNLLIFALVLSVLIIAHEFGHYVVARFVGIRVEKFSIGFGPVILGRKIGQTQFCVSLLPLGGFVKLAGETSAESGGAPWEYMSKSFGQKVAMTLAGPLMNAFLAFLLFAVIALIGEPTPTAKIGKVLPQMPAAEAGILADDRVLAINGVKVVYWQELLSEIQKTKTRMVLTIDRDGKRLEIGVTPRKGMSLIGIASSGESVTIRHGLGKAVFLGAEHLVKLSLMLIISLGAMISGAMPFKDSMAGPIGIYFMTGEAAARGLVYLLFFMGSLSVSLFVLNLLPIPVLDGGHIFFLVIEKIKGSPLKESVKERMTQGGLALLLLLTVFVIFQDINRYPVLRNLKKVFLSVPWVAKEALK